MNKRFFFDIIEISNQTYFVEIEWGIKMKENKCKGFTLIELLAVIVILAVIALITVPMIMNVIEKSRKEAFKDSVLGAFEAVDYYLLKNNLSEITEEGINVTDLDLKNNRLSGSIHKNEEGNLEVVNVSDGRYCAQGIQTKLVITKGTCGSGSGAEGTEGNGSGGSSGTTGGTGSGGSGTATKIYGVKRSIESESSVWERIGDATNLVAQAQIGESAEEIQNDFDNIYPWSDIKTYNYNTETQQITAWIGDNNFSFDGSNGEVLTYIPEFYYRRYQENGYEYIYISNHKVNDNYSKSDAFSIGRYILSFDRSNSKFHSASGVSLYVNKTITQFRNFAKTLGDDFGQLDYHYFIIQLLYLVEYADYNSQAKLGKGNVNNHEGLLGGGCNDLGMKSGTLVDDGKHSMIYRGMEDIYGNIYQYVDGINIKDYQVFVCYDPSQYESNKYDGCYKPLGYINANSEGYIQKLGYDKNQPLIAFPIEIGGNENTYISDYYWHASGNQPVCLGGSYSLIDSKAGLWSWMARNNSTNIGARLIKYK